MFGTLGQFVSRWWHLLLVGWILLLLGLEYRAPLFEDVVRDGQFRYMPEAVPSRQGKKLFQRSFSNDLMGSNIYLVVRREFRDEGLTEDDRTFIEEVLRPRLEQIAKEEGGLAQRDDEEDAAEEEFDEEELDDVAPDDSDETSSDNEERSVIAQIRTFEDKALGDLLQSKDNKASLVRLELSTEFMQYRNAPTIEKIEQLIGKNGELYREALIPPGLDLSLSGSAAVGRDMRQAARESASATETWTILLVVILLVAIYRAPVLAFIPLVTVYLSVKIALMTLALLADAGIVGLFTGIEVYVTVVLYGAGVDYCMFLMARYKEELDAGATFDEAIANAVGKVGAALAASAGTTMCGIGMMVFAQFGKFQQAGVAMSFSLFFVLCASLTFAPAMLRMFGRWAFWPYMRTERISAAAGWVSPTSLMARLMEKDWFRGLWDRVGKSLLKKPGTIWLTCVLLMSPFAIFGGININFSSYGLLSELPQDDPSVVGTKAVQAHFPAGATGPVTVLLTNRTVDFSKNDGINAIEELTDKLQEANQQQQLGIEIVRSVAHPLGHKKTAENNSSEAGKGRMSIFKKRAERHRAVKYYVSDSGELENHVTRLDIVFDKDPFSRDSIRQFDRFRETMVSVLPESLAKGTELSFVGNTPSIRDLKSVTESDRLRINLLVLLGVFAILWILLRRPAISAYLILSVFFSYLATLGVTFAVFWMLDPAGFAGLDWKVPMFLFTILIAVGEDYNIYLITRIEEEQLRWGLVEGVTVALSKTGSIISSCGVIMAGTFSSLMAGNLVGMNQLGFALAFGVLLDTFVVRPVLVPAYLILLHRGRFGHFGKWLGAGDYVPTELTPSLRVGTDRRD
jgi:RND superfamily putative drug exporter